MNMSVTFDELEIRGGEFYVPGMVEHESSSTIGCRDDSSALVVDSLDNLLLDTEK